MPFPFEIATGDVRISGVVVTVDGNTKKAERIKRMQVSEDTTEDVGYDSDDGRPDYANGF